MTKAQKCLNHHVIVAMVGLVFVTLYVWMKDVDWRQGLVAMAGFLGLIGWTGLLIAASGWKAKEIELEARQRWLQERADSMLSHYAERVKHSSEEGTRGERRMAADMGQPAIATRDKDEISFGALHSFVRSELKLETRPKITDYSEAPRHRRQAP
jgi:hypothetical protein